MKKKERKGDKIMYCKNCGTQNLDNALFCKECGAKLEKEDTAKYNAVSNVPSNQSTMDMTPISMWGYFGYEILFSIPLVGFILLLVFSFGGTKNVNLRNFARSYFCFLIVLVVILFVLLGTAGLSSVSGF